jgi:hypothetical protein
MAIAICALCTGPYVAGSVALPDSRISCRITHDVPGLPMPVMM